MNPCRKSLATWVRKAMSRLENPGRKKVNKWRKFLGRGCSTLLLISLIVSILLRTRSSHTFQCLLRHSKLYLTLHLFVLFLSYVSSLCPLSKFAFVWYEICFISISFCDLSNSEIEKTHGHLEHSFCDQDIFYSVTTSYRERYKLEISELYMIVH